MSSELIALSDAYSAVVNMEGGGTLSRTVYDDDARFRALIEAIILPGLSDDATAQAVTGIQMVLDRGDGSAYAQYVLRSRLRPGAAVPDYLFGITLGDSVVTNAASYSLARALGIPHVAAQLEHVVGLTASSAAVPLRGNSVGGATAGLLQYDVILDGAGVVRADHDTMPTSEVARASIGSFLSSHFAEGTATIIDPYVEVGLAHGPPTP